MNKEIRWNRKFRGKWLMSLKLGDLFLYAMITLIAAGLLVYAAQMRKETDVHAVLAMDGETVAEISAETMTGQGVLQFEAYGYSYQIIYDTGRVRFAEADCPDQICVHTGWLSLNGELAACVPGHLVLRITSDEMVSPDADEWDVIIR